MEKRGPKNGEHPEREERSFNREDSGRNDDKSFSPFAKDKRKRITRIEKTEPRRRDDSGDTGSGQRNRDYNREDKPRFEKRGEGGVRKPYSGSAERHSYNPNFTKDNKLRDDNRFNRSDYSGDKKPVQRDYSRSEGKSERDFNRTDIPRERDFNRNGDNNRPTGRNYGDRDFKSGRPTGNDRFNKPGRDSKGYEGNRNSKSGNYGSDKGYSKRDSGDYRSKSSIGGYGNDRDRDDRRSSRPAGYPRKDKPQYRGDKPRPGRGRQDKIEDHGRYKDGSYPAFPAPDITDDIRLNRYIAAAGKSSRREADDMIREGRVTVNGIVVTEMGSKIKAGDEVQVDGQTIQSENKVYILMNKPKGFVTTLEDPFAEKTVMDLLKNACSERVYPVGRLDKNSLGVLLVTNDGDLTTQLTHPSFNKKKIYQVTLDKPLTRADMQNIVDGIVLDDGEIHADEISYVDDSKKEIGIEIHSGRNRIVRRIFEHLGYKVTKLDRVYFASLTKKNLKRGQWRFLTPKEVDILKSGRYE